MYGRVSTHECACFGVVTLSAIVPFGLAFSGFRGKRLVCLLRRSTASDGVEEFSCGRFVTLAARQTGLGRASPPIPHIHHVASHEAG